MSDELKRAAQALVDAWGSNRALRQAAFDALRAALASPALSPSAWRCGGCGGPMRCTNPLCGAPSPSTADRLKDLAQRFVDEVREDGKGPFMAAHFLSWGEFSGEACAPSPSRDAARDAALEEAAREADAERKAYMDHSEELDRSGAHYQAAGDLHGALACQTVASRIRSLKGQPPPAESDVGWWNGSECRECGRVFAAVNATGRDACPGCGWTNQQQADFERRHAAAPADQSKETDR